MGQENQDKGSARLSSIRYFVPDDQVEPETCVCCSKNTSPLFLSISTNHFSCFQTILKFHPEEISSRNRIGRTALHHAVDYKYVHFIEPLVRKGANLEDVDCIGWTALTYAIKSRIFRSISQLLILGAELHLTKLSSDDLQWLEDNGFEGDVEAAVESSHPVETSTPPAQETPLPNTVDDFNERGRDELKRYWCETIDAALHKAAFIDHTDFIEMKIEGKKLRKFLVKHYRMRGFVAENYDKDRTITVTFFG